MRACWQFTSMVWDWCMDLMAAWAICLAVNVTNAQPATHKRACVDDRSGLIDSGTNDKSLDLFVLVFSLRPERPSKAPTYIRH